MVTLELDRKGFKFLYFMLNEISPFSVGLRHFSILSCCSSIAVWSTTKTTSNFVINNICFVNRFQKHYTCIAVKRKGTSRRSRGNEGRLFRAYLPSSPPPSALAFIFHSRTSYPSLPTILSICTSATVYRLTGLSLIGAGRLSRIGKSLP